MAELIYTIKTDEKIEINLYYWLMEIYEYQ